MWTEAFSAEAWFPFIYAGALVARFSPLLFWIGGPGLAAHASPRSDFRPLRLRVAGSHPPALREQRDVLLQLTFCSGWRHSG